MNKPFLLFLILICVIACKKESSFFETYQEGGHEVTAIRLSAHRDTVSRSLSDIAKDIRIVPLETSDSCLIGITNYLISDEYIISIGVEKLILFDANGKYIKTLARQGRGPNEFNITNSFAFSRQKDAFYLADYIAGCIHYWHLPGGEYKRIPLKNTDIIANVAEINDTTLLIANLSPLSSDYSIYTQNLSGEILHSARRDSKHVHKGNDNERSFYEDENYLYYRPTLCDSIYRFANDTLSLSHAFLPEPKESINFHVFNGHYILCSSFVPRSEEYIESYQGRGPVTITRGDNYFYFINRKNKQVSCCKMIRNDILPLELTSCPFIFQGDSIVWTYYKPHLLQAKIPEILKRNNIEPAMRKRLTALQNTVHEDDNPVLLIGKLKFDY